MFTLPKSTIHLVQSSVNQHIILGDIEKSKRMFFVNIWTQWILTYHFATSLLCTSLLNSDNCNADLISINGSLIAGNAGANGIMGHTKGGSGGVAAVTGIAERRASLAYT